MAARVTHSGNGIEIGLPQQLGSIGANDEGPFASDGQRFLVLQRDPAPAGVPTQVVRNWSALLVRQAR